MSPTVVVVGYCASGKSSVVNALRAEGVAAEAVAQEHSIAQNLWNHHQPQLVVFLDVSLDQIRARRRNPRWPDWLYGLQTERLCSARVRADLTVDTSPLELREVVRQVMAFVGDVSDPDGSGST